LRTSALLAATAVLSAALACACGGPTEEPESLSASELVARTYEAMTEESFALDVPPELASPQPDQPPYSIKYGPPDLLLITGGGYEWPAYFFLVGKETYMSETGKQWNLAFRRPNHGLRLLYDPRELLRIATDLRDEGTQELDGKPHRVVAGQRDLVKFADEYLADSVRLVLSITVIDYPCPECPFTFDRQRLEELGYRNPDGRGMNLFKDQDIWIDARAESVRFEVQGIRELSPALEDEFREVLEAYSVDPDLLDTAEVGVFDEREQSLEEAAGDVRFWIDPETFLVSKMEVGWAGGEERIVQMGEVAFVDYGKTELPKPEPAMLDEEADVLFGTIQVRWRPLAEALEAYAAAHGGLYPDEVTATALQDALESEGLDWPDNAFTGEPMQESLDRNPGDFYYQPSPDRRDYCAEVYPWEGPPVGVSPGPADGGCPLDESP